jgi:predicted phage terminase large subunit-like protein
MKRIELLETKKRCLEEKLRKQSMKSLLRFTMSTMPTFRPAVFHRYYYDVLTKFAFGEIRKLMVFMPPQHGKSEGSTRRLPAFILGIKPDTKVAMVSYSAQKAMKFNRELQRIIDTQEYRNIFPDTCLNGKNISSLAKEGNWLRNAYECEVVGHNGGFKTVGVGGALTGEPVDVMILDDIYKDAASAWSATVRESISDWYDTVAETRLHNDSQQLIVFTRWHEEDLAGKLIREQGVYDAVENPDGWVIVTYKAIKEGMPTEYDPREEGEPLWPERHSLHKLELVRQRNPHVFESLYQQNPMPAEGLMYSLGFRTYSTIPATKNSIVKAYCDTADTGADYLCDIIYVETETANYILDVLYTQKPMEYTEPKTAERYTKYDVKTAVVESNSGGRSFARNVESQCRMMGNNTTSFVWFYQNQNKQVRIFTHSAEVQNLTYFPEGWERLWPEFHKAIMSTTKEGRMDHDDAPDALTGTIEQRGELIPKDIEKRLSQLM